VVRYSRPGPNSPEMVSEATASRAEFSSWTADALLEHMYGYYRSASIGAR
jgi:hypothetical protein